MSKSLGSLRDQLSEEQGDYHHATVTTALTTSTSVIDTALANIEGGGTTDYFEDWWLLVTSEENDGAKRIVASYSASTTTLTMQGGNFTDDGSDKATYELHRYDPETKKRAINSAAREIYPTLFKVVQNRELIAGNVIPPFHFTASTALTFWTTSDSGITKTTTAGLYYGQRGGASAKVLTTDTNGRIHISSDDYPRLLDASGNTLSGYVWVRPQTANDATLAFYSIKADGTEETHTSTTACPADKWTLLKLEDKLIQSGAEEIQIRLIVATSGQYAYFMCPRVEGKPVYDYILPYDLLDGTVKQVNLQIDGDADDIGVGRWTPVFGWETIDDGTYQYLRMPYWATDRMLELIGYAPLEDNLSADTDTMSIKDPYTNLFIAQAALEFFRIMRGPATQEATQSYEREIAYYTDEVRRKSRTLRMPKPHGQISWGL